MPTDPPIWADVRHAFEHSPETVAVIARRYGVTRCQIIYRARARGWTPRPSGADSLRIATFKRALGLKPPSVIEPLPPSPIPERSQFKQAGLEHKAAGGFGSRSHRAALIKRFYEIVDLKLAEIERRLKSDATLTQPEAERETREIGNPHQELRKADRTLRCARSLLHPPHRRCRHRHGRCGATPPGSCSAP